MKTKTLHDIRPPELSKEASGAIPHVFHRHGALYQGTNAVIDTTKTITLPLRTDTEKMVAYGSVAAGDAMVRENPNADKSLIAALRLAVGHRLMQTVGAHEGPIGLATLFGPSGGIYLAALEAMAHYGTANQASILKTIRRGMLKAGLRHQASVLQPLIGTAIELALEFDHAGLDWFYRQFHALYGTPNKEPQKGDCVMPEDAPPETLPEMALLPSPPSTTSVDWGPMDMATVPMNGWKHPRIRSKSSWKYSEFGVFKYPWRALPSSDYRCFSLRRPRYGGTLLIDMSGSMAIDQAQLNQILHLAPYATIAAYASWPKTSQYGRLVLIAKDMKKGSGDAARKLLGSGNVVDGPALHWLALQTKPRIWISDGGVTGIGDTSSPYLRLQANVLSASAQIIRIPTLADLIDRLT